jgi:hypothetical protein
MLRRHTSPPGERHMLRVVLTLILGVVTASCSDKSEPMAGQNSQPPSFSVTVDPTLAAGATDDERQRLISEATQAVLARTPEDLRDRARAMLEDPAASPVTSTDPEIARQLGIIQSVRAAVAAEAQSQETPSPRVTQEELDAAVSVTVALVPTLPVSHAQAVVVRRPGDDGVPLLLLSEGTVTTETLALGLRAAAIARDRHGPQVERTQMDHLRFAKKRAAPDMSKYARYEPYLTALRATKTTRLDPYGDARIMSVGVLQSTLRAIGK